MFGKFDIFQSESPYADYVFIATPTDYDPENDYFDTTTVESVIQDALKFNKNIIIVIRSTIPIGFVDSMREKYNFKISKLFLPFIIIVKRKIFPSRKAFKIFGQQ